jgi:hypothetical protein
MRHLLIVLLALYPYFVQATLISDPVGRYEVANKNVAFKNDDKIYPKNVLSFDEINIELDGYSFKRGGFLSEEESTDGKSLINYSRDVFFSDETSYGWGILVHSNKVGVELKEVLTLPEPSPDWNISDETKLLENGRIAVTKRFYPINDGIVYNSWGFSKNDPKGKYRFQIYYGENLIYEVEFNVK